MANNQSRFLPDVLAADSAWLFPGQGAQEVGMGFDLWRDSPAARSIFETADRVLGYELSRLCFEGPEEVLRETEQSQPAILATSLACLAAALERDAVSGRPAFMAGHSLGEYTALVAAGALSLEDGLRLVRERGRLMALAGKLNPGAMAAIVGLDEEAVFAICREAGAEVCNLNLPSQTVIGGSRDAVARAIELAGSRGARSSVELRVSGAFHTSLMKPALQGLGAALDAVAVAPPAVPVVANTDARLLRDVAAVREELAAQVARPVQWHQSIRLIAEAGVSVFHEFGPGRVLTGLARRVIPAARVINVRSLGDLANVSGGEPLPA